MASTRHKNPSLCNDIKALKGRPAKDSPRGVPGSCGQGWALPSSLFLLALEIGAGGCFWIIPASKTPWELLGDGSELPGRDLGWGVEGSLGRAQLHRAASALPGTALPQDVCSQRAPEQPLWVFLMHKTPSTTAAAAPGLPLPPRAQPSSFAGHFLPLACTRKRGKPKSLKNRAPGGECALCWDS
ncbi:hypothetical protein DV515_00018257 [Chloebia gouldiae]|uniref:Uncharacterized protein n=1 Tax=Chloebia gouldiae TaxID=44316 RepID=A0A3L8Q8T4_CHLGU|nr:hypothetical protein DV515_00018257 [Chloebia gouldiae]